MGKEELEKRHEEAMLAVAQAQASEAEKSRCTSSHGAVYGRTR